MSDFKGLLAPASELLRPKLVPVSTDLSQLEQYLQGLPEQARYDRDCVLFVNGQGHLMNMARNERATTYIHEHSEAAQRGNFRSTSRDDYYLAGPVVILGSDEDGSLTDVPDRLITHFGVTRDLGVQPG